MKGALDKSNRIEEDKTEEKSDDKSVISSQTDQSKVDYQLARALDLIRGVSIFKNEAARP